MIESLLRELDYLVFLTALSFLMLFVLTRTLSRNFPPLRWSFLAGFATAELIAAGCEFFAHMKGGHTSPMWCAFLNLGAVAGLLPFAHSCKAHSAAIQSGRNLLRAGILAGISTALLNVADAYVPGLEILSTAFAILMITFFWEFFLLFERKRSMGGTWAYRALEVGLLMLLFAGWAVTIEVSRQAEATDRLPRQAHLYMMNQLLSSLRRNNEFVIDAYAGSPELLRRLRDSSSVAAQEADRILDKIASYQNGSVAYLADNTGDVLASSNRDDPKSLVGMNYGRRPYFQSAVAGERGFYLAVGLRTGMPGIFTSVPIRDKGGKVLGALVLKSNLTQHNIFGSLDDPGFLVQENGIVLLSNRPSALYHSFQSISDSVRAELLKTRQFPTIGAKPLLPVEPPDGSRIQFEGRAHHFWKSGTSLPGWSVILLGRDQSRLMARGSIVGFTFLFAMGLIGFFRAREKELASQQHVAESEQRYRAIFQDNLAVMIQLRTDGTFEDANKSACEFYGYSLEKLRTMRIQDINVDPEVTNSGLSSVQQIGRAYFEARHRRSDGTLRNVEVYTMRLTLHEGPRIVSIIHDVTGRKRMEKEQESMRAQLFHSEKLASLGTLAAGLGHEINNPLAIVAGFGGMLRSRLSKLLQNDREALTACFGILDKQDSGIKRISDIIDGLRTYARSDSSGSFEVVNAHNSLREILSMIGQIFQLADVRVQLELNSTSPRFLGSPGQMQQVLMNLLTNARDAFDKSTGPKRITIATKDAGDRFTIEISDNGCGIPAGNLERIFDPFYTTKAPGKGTGLGLPICRSIIEGFSGKLSVSSKVGHGTTFTISLPVARQEVGRNSEAGSARHPKDKVEPPRIQLSGRLLIVDDEAELREVIRATIEPSGLSITEAGNGEEALAILEREAPDFVIVDMRMPRMSGEEMIRRALEFPHVAQKTRFITTSGAELPPQCRSDGHFMKPLDMSDLLKRLKQLSEGKRQ